MNRVACSACNQDVVPNPPNHAYWALIVAFWVFSLLFGLGAAVGSGWGFMLLVAWVLLATTTGVLVQRATSWSCSECGASVVVPEGDRPAAARPRRPTHAHA
ncbi:MAG: hypothetical protein KIS78_35575 [Labilithrix sp.]|nr:hypothetical protein [Labilithrix sp.]